MVLGRRLGYPLKLVTNPVHVFARWEDGKESFNIEASNPGGMVTFDDEHYRHWPHEMHPYQTECGYYLRSLSAVDELALFLISRAWVLEAHQRYAEALPFMAKCLELAPNEPEYARRSAFAVGYLLDVFHGQKPRRARGGIPGETLRVYDYRHDPRKVIPDPAQAAMALFILGHWQDINGQAQTSIQFFSEAHRLQPDNSYYASRLDQAIGKLALSIETTDENDKLLVSHGPFPCSQTRETEKAMACRSRGLRLEREGKLHAAQAAFAHAFLWDSYDQSHRLCLRRAVRKELLVLQDRRLHFVYHPSRLLAHPTTTDGDLAVSVVLGQVGQVLEEYGRFADAVLAYCDAFIRCITSPACSGYWYAAANAARRLIAARSVLRHEPPAQTILQRREAVP